ncbi:MAG: bifunctional demethylmenaquinone methyltransferase/2-methoxy-6-polyprenyl-1,4-benzoquinol methylase UbiE [Gammaproteobacteria bacterium]|jgi:demethylmenaquinone methyltransferase/2-methoxy-6-polyprenyl-1,4-benzoquinol methylase|nr:bifunctional demethylmenaquinone methyltransferase/2-methoxy-6-polyprenyl-1,4-benzoquinol methylase UbiE [Gammaproteobacteria bacterium]MDP6096836.1 bifunctional demethylmenaquinone methyltransferase/2-methoxy-6-polyprenyl-1,4-benzoquinol methylase UbiE [Gammaproteobacteria bacterium]MDP7456025.1 bifunctional demethylmenaquinone methyltransferase/2-methoxy-6-polyprenyl-1,4-benzoquinol methylase UbiE [Gammaproteobacteria bacterium]HJO12026.1 bifunctional demethylmenaquinone methyltransferase/2|tara:strand:- start:837 stop:1625 length:789 start_codon:yes stop_codon:yes gene_type:complete
MTESTDGQETTHFGYEEVPVAEKAQRVGQVFRSVANKYDIMNDVMSLGTHRLIKRFTVELSALREGHKVLDLAGGTGDFTMRFSPLVGREGHVILADINEAMLNVGRDRIIDRGVSHNVSFAQVNAEDLPFADNTFDCICIAYGLRNVTDKDAALKSMHRVLKPGGSVLVLEFSRPGNPALEKAYEMYSKLWPIAGKMVTGDGESYRYLVESIRMHPDQATLVQMMQDAGFDNCRYHDVIGGICAVHLGLKQIPASTVGDNT